MADMREELVQKIERARQQLNQNIDTKAAYHYSVELDKLLNQYIGLETETERGLETAL